MIYIDIIGYPRNKIKLTIYSRMDSLKKNYHILGDNYIKLLKVTISSSSKDICESNKYSVRYIIGIAGKKINNLLNDNNILHTNNEIIKIIEEINHIVLVFIVIIEYAIECNNDTENDLKNLDKKAEDYFKILGKKINLLNEINKALLNKRYYNYLKEKPHSANSRTTTSRAPVKLPLSTNTSVISQPPVKRPFATNPPKKSVIPHPPAPKSPTPLKSTR